MSHPQRPNLMLCSLLGVSLLAGCTSYRGPSAMGAAPSMDGAPVEYSGGSGRFSTAQHVDTGLLVPDGNGGLIHVPGRDHPNPESGYAEAQELRLKVRELAAQLLEVDSTQSINGLVALPTSFVDLNDFTESNPLGRYMAEAMFYEFNQRGVPVREYRLNGKIRMAEAEGEFALTRNLAPLAVKNGWAAVLVGTYLKDENGIFVNARLVRPSDGLVLRTAQLVLDNNSVLARLTVKPPFTPGTLHIRPGTSPSRKNAVAGKARASASSARSGSGSAALVPANSPVQPSTSQIQARQALHELESQPQAGANIASSANTANSPSGSQNGAIPSIYSGPAEAVPDVDRQSPSPIPGPPKNT